MKERERERERPFPSKKLLRTQLYNRKSTFFTMRLAPFRVLSSLFVYYQMFCNMPPRNGTKKNGTERVLFFFLGVLNKSKNSLTLFSDLSPLSIIGSVLPLSLRCSQCALPWQRERTARAR